MLKQSLKTHLTVPGDTPDSMPPDHDKHYKTGPKHEAQIQAALKDLQNGTFIYIKDAAKAHNVSSTNLLI
jgi:hypothetical protein